MGKQSRTPERDFGRRLRHERTQRGWTQLELARRLATYGINLHPSAIAKIEDHDAEQPRAIRLDEAQAFAEIFGMRIDEMLSPENDVKRAVRTVGAWMASLNDDAEFGRQLLDDLDDTRSLADEVDDAALRGTIDRVRRVARLVIQQLDAAAQEGARMIHPSFQIASLTAAEQAGRPEQAARIVFADGTEAYVDG